MNKYDFSLHVEGSTHDVRNFCNNIGRGLTIPRPALSQLIKDGKSFECAVDITSDGTDTFKGGVKKLHEQDRSYFIAWSWTGSTVESVDKIAQLSSLHPNLDFFLVGSHDLSVTLEVHARNGAAFSRKGGAA